MQYICMHVHLMHLHMRGENDINFNTKFVNKYNHRHS